MLLERAEHDLLVPRGGYTPASSALDERTSAIIGHLPCTPLATALLPHVVDYFLTGVLAPAVIVSTDSASACAVVEPLVHALEVCLSGRLRLIRGVDPLVVKINRALYDACDARSLRDEILDLQAPLPVRYLSITPPLRLRYASVTPPLRRRQGDDRSAGASPSLDPKPPDPKP